MRGWRKPRRGHAVIPLRGGFSFLSILEYAQNPSPDALPAVLDIHRIAGSILIEGPV